MTSTHAAPTKVVTLADGREVAVDINGPVDGAPVLFLHSAPGSRVLDPDPVVTAEAGVRLITIDRPGYGGSSPWPAAVPPNVAGIARDLVAVLELLGTEAVPVIGWSAGGRVGAAMAAQRPDVVTRLVIVGTPAPDDQVPWVPEEHRAMSRAMRAEPQSAVASLSTALAPMADDIPGSVAAVTEGPVDAATLAQPGVRARIEAMLREAFRAGVGGLAADIVSDQVVPWGFDVADISVPLTAFYGDADERVPPAHGQWYVDQAADGELRVVAGAGHLVVLTAWRDILSTAMLGE